MKGQFEQLAIKLADTENSTSMTLDSKGAQVRPPRITKTPSVFN